MYNHTNERNRVTPREVNQYKYVDLACLVIHAVWMILFFYEGIYMLGILNTVSCIVYGYLYFALRESSVMRAVVLCYSEVIIHSIAALLSLGFAGGFDLYILIFIPIMFFYSLVYAGGHKLLFFGGVAAGAVYIVLKVVTFFIEPVYAFTDSTIEFLIMIFNCGMCIFGLLIITYKSCQEINQNRHKLEEKNKELTFLSCHDPLTKLLNRRSMEEIITKIQVGQGSDKAAGVYEKNAVAFFDVDNFKHFNDVYGHECGDAVLVKVAEIINTYGTRNIHGADKSQYCCRWGGEEIIILFHNWEKEEVVHRVTQIKKKIGQSSFSYADDKITISVTCGLAFSIKEESIYELINEADAYMLKGKKNGKNCIIQAENT